MTRSVAVSPAQRGKLSIGIEHLPQWERVAIVTDVGAVRHTVTALRFLIPGKVRVFTTHEAYQGCA